MPHGAGRVAGAEGPGMMPPPQGTGACGPSHPAASSRHEPPEQTALSEIQSLIKLRKYKNIISICTDELFADPNQYHFMINLAFALQKLGRYDEALYQYRRLREIEPDNQAWMQWEKEIVMQRARIRAKKADITLGGAGLALVLVSYVSCFFGGIENLASFFVGVSTGLLGIIGFFMCIASLFTGSGRSLGLAGTFVFLFKIMIIFVIGLSLRR
jgi:hypothetical protein